MPKGRPKKQGQRYKCGKRTIYQRQQDAQEVGVSARLRRYRLQEDKAYIVRDEKGAVLSALTGKQIAESNILGSPLGRLQHWNYISADQAIAGHDFAVTMRDYLATAQLQRPTQGKAGFVPTVRSSHDSPEPVRGESKARAYMEALAEIDRTDPFSGPTSTSVVWDVCVNENDRPGEAAIGALRVGLNAIHRVLYGRKAA